MVYSDRLFSGLERNDITVGSLLLSAPKYEISRAAHSPVHDFRRTAMCVINIDHNGVVYAVRLNMRSENAVANFSPEWLPLVAQPQIAYFGGPVAYFAHIALGVVKKGHDIPKGCDHLGSRVITVNLEDDPQKLLSELEGIRFYSGWYTWDIKALEEDIAQGDWFVTDTLPSDIIAPANSDIWGDAMRRQNFPLPLYATFPKEIKNN